MKPLEIRFRLLPRRFKLIGVLVIVVPIVTAVILRLLNVKLKTHIEEAQLAHIARSVVISGILLIILSKEKVEDEFINTCRLYAFSFSFLTGIGLVIVNPIIDFKEGITPMQIVLGEMFTYLFVFHLLRKGIGWKTK